MIEILTHHFRRLRPGANLAWCIPAVFTLCICLSPGQARGELPEDHDSTVGGSGPGLPGDGLRPGAGARRPTGGGCRVSPGALADFANGDRYDYSQMVTYLTSADCAAASYQVSQAAMSAGVTFNNKAPYNLDRFASNLSRNSLESGKRLDASLQGSLPGIMRSNPLSATEMLPIVGQLAILSPSTARFAMGQLIKKELEVGDQLIQSGGARGRQVGAVTLAQTLVRLGATEGVIASEMAQGVEEMALLAQADSLAKYFRALASAASVEAALVPTFNLTAGAFNRGVQRGWEEYAERDRRSVLVSLFKAVQAGISASAALEPGVAELNDALGAMMQQRSITATSLKKLWSEAVRILAISGSQPALASAVALSLTPEFVFLKPSQTKALMAASRNYPSVAGAVQRTFLMSWQKMWQDLNEGRLPVARFNRMKRRYFEPMVKRILGWDPYLIDPYWLGMVVRADLVKDEDVEKRFPRLVLAFLERRDRASKVATLESGLEPTVSSLTENLAVLWALSSVHVPALIDWVAKYDQ